MSEQQRAFFQSLKVAYISTEHPNSSLEKVRIWGSVIAGEGLITCNTATAIKIKISGFPPGDAVNLKVGSHVGILGLELHLRRRCRLNAVVIAQTSTHIMLTVQQAFGNCPKYIQARKIEISPPPAVPTIPVRVASDKGPLDAKSLELVSRSDTFFLATSSGSKEPTHPATALGCDMSHRGGPAGFVEVQEHPAARNSKSYHTLRWGDYAGNNMFNSLGNIALHPRAGMLFIDWETGDTLQVTGPVDILYDEHRLPGAERTLELTVHAWVFTQRGLPLACPAPLIEASPYNPAGASLSTTSDAAVVTQPIAVECIATYEESSTVVSFEFALPPSLQKRLAHSPVLPGQYATFDFPLRGGQSLTRTWTISSDAEYIAGRSSFMISVKRVGQVTDYMHDRVVPGVKLTLKAIAGTFTPDYAHLRETNQSVLLIAAGIGITPIKAMFRGFLEHNIPITLLYSVRELSETVFRRDFEDLAAQYPDRKCQLYLTATRERSSPTASRKSGATDTRTARNGVFAQRTGRIDADMIHAAAPDLRNMSVFLCGPEGFMRDVSDALLGPLRFPYPERIFSESFSY
jgi:ferredoxin-NADP reductase/predicted pyridoxine 5'-phosphate oxidase superfamily flavin-nucleotide-binding protein